MLKDNWFQINLKESLFLTLGFIILIVNLFYIYLAFIKQYPLTPWDGGMVVESWRAANNIPVYENIQDFHATHLYGYLYTYYASYISQIFGFSNYTLRILSFISFVLSISLIMASLNLVRKNWYLLLGISLIFSVNYQSGNYFIFDRPDASALLYSVISIVFFYIGYERNKWLFILLGTLTILITFSIKQTYLMVASVPLIVLFLSFDKKKIFQNVLKRLIPILLFLVYIFILKIVEPYIPYYMLILPSKYMIQYDALFYGIYVIVFSSPLFIFLLYEFSINYKKYYSPKIIWIISAIIITIPLSSFTAAKIWGTINSYIPALISISTFNTYILYKYLAIKKQKSEISISLTLLLIFLVICSCFPFLPTQIGSYYSIYISNILLFIIILMSILRYFNLHENFNKEWLIVNKKYNNYMIIVSVICILLIIIIGGSRYIFVIKNEINNHINIVQRRNLEYSNIINISKDLEGKVISPEDPTIVLYSRWKAERNIYFELDANPINGNIPDQLPIYLNRYLLSADYIIHPKDWWYERISSEKIQSINFIKVYDSDYYSVWKNNNK